MEMQPNVSAGDNDGHHWARLPLRVGSRASNQWERVLFHRPVGPRSECSAVAGQADFVDVCNGVDEDCDGSIDEGSPGTGEACEGPNLNVCEVAITACDEAGQLVCQAVAVEPRREGL